MQSSSEQMLLCIKGWKELTRLSWKLTACVTLSNEPPLPSSGATLVWQCNALKVCSQPQQCMCKRAGQKDILSHRKMTHYHPLASTPTENPQAPSFFQLLLGGLVFWSQCIFKKNQKSKEGSIWVQKEKSWFKSILKIEKSWQIKKPVRDFWYSTIISPHTLPSMFFFNTGSHHKKKTLRQVIYGFGDRDANWQ